MAKIKNKQELISKIKNAEGFSNEEKSQMLALLNENKTYGLVWENSTEDAWEMMKDYVPVMKEDESKRIDHGSENPNHILIEGDNLNALTALSYTHEGKIDVIYIDPPYNTGNNDFVYNDKFIGEDDSYRHSKWLSFMEKRLKIAKRFMSEKGVIFISIDDNEQANLKLLSDEVFGAEKFVATIPWRKRTAKADVPYGLSQDYEWILCYANNSFKAGIEKESRKYYETPDFPGRPWRVHDLTKQTTALERPKSYFTIVNPKTGKKYPANPNATWRITEETFPQYYSENRIVFPGDYAFLRISKPVLRYWKADDEKKAGELFGFTTASTNLPNEVGMTQDGTKDLDAIFGNRIFGFPKPISLISYLLKIATPKAKNLIIVDFFAGSGTTLHATMQLNAEDGGHRQCILVTNNENNICEEVTYERNKRVIEGYTTPKGEKVEGLKDNNLRYFKVGFTPREKTDENMFRLAKNSVNLLRIKHDVYKETQFGALENPYKRYRYFEEDGKQLLVILDTELIGDIVEQLEEMEVSKPIPTYVFTTGAYPFTEDFESVADKVELYPLPHGLYQACERNMPKMVDKEIENPEGISLSDEEQETSMDDLTKEEA